MKQRVYLIDGSSFIYRAYYAIRPLSNSKGIPTNAIYGFVTMLNKLLANEKPTHIAVCFDRKEPTFRHKKYAEYKAQRKPTPEDLIAQIPHIKEVVAAYNIPVIELPGYEADDLLATLAVKAAEDGFESYIVTSDKDILQLVTDSIKVLNVYKDNLLYDRETVKERFGGIAPEGLIDIMGLMGDTSDNIPGVPGIGEKTAIKLIQEFGSIEGVYASLDALKGATKKKIETHKELAFLSRDLVTLECNAPIPYSRESLAWSHKNNEALTALFTKFEFTRLLAGVTPETKVVTHEKKYTSITDRAALKSLATTIMQKGACAFDTETTGIDPHSASLLGISLAHTPHEAYYIPYVLHAEQQMCITPEDIHHILGPIFEKDAIHKYGQNCKYDVHILERHGFTLRGITFDTMIASYLLTPNIAQHNLDAIALKYLGLKKVEYATLVGKGKSQCTLQEVPIDTVTQYACEDADAVFLLVPILEEELRKKNSLTLFNTLEMPLMRVLGNIETNGVAIDSAFLKTLSDAAEQELGTLEGSIFSEAGEEFNINSPKQVGHILFEVLKLPVIKKTKTGFSTDVNVLEKLARQHTVPQLLLEYREIAKLKSTYLDALPQLINEKTGLLHTSFNQTITSTGRLSSSTPNLQNIPIKTKSGRRVREAFVPRKEDHCILAADYSQIELRILAHVSHDITLTEAFAHNNDIHTVTATHLYDVEAADVTRDMRTVAKTINFSIIYGKTAYGLAQDLGMPIGEAAAFIEEYFVTYSGIRTYIDETKALAKKQGYTETLLGRKCYFPDINSSNQTVRQFAERAAVNAPIQGSAADLIKKAMITIQDIFVAQKLQTKMILQVHDELVFDVANDEKSIVADIVKTEMEKALPLSVPLLVDMSWGHSWAKQ